MSAAVHSGDDPTSVHQRTRVRNVETVQTCSCRLSCLCNAGPSHLRAPLPAYLLLSCGNTRDDVAMYLTDCDVALIGQWRGMMCGIAVQHAGVPGGGVRLPGQEPGASPPPRSCCRCASSRWGRRLASRPCLCQSTSAYMYPTPSVLSFLAFEGRVDAASATTSQTVC